MPQQTTAEQTMGHFLRTAALFLLTSVGSHATPFFPLDASNVRSYSTSEGVEVARFQRETTDENTWKEELRREDDRLLEATWFSTAEEGILLHRTMRFDPQATVTVEFLEPVLFLPDNFPRRRKWAGRVPATMVVELNLRSTPLRVRVRMTYTYQFVVGEKETVEQWTAIPVAETAIIHLASVEPDTGSPQLDAMLRQLLAQPGALSYRAGGVLKWSATRWFAQEVGEVKSEEVAVAPNGASQTRVRTLTPRP